MARNCIICGKAAGSREHVFPAALGGRRTNKGIYCGEHNQGFSPLAAILAEQLRGINSLLAVRPDHSDAPAAFQFVGEDGAKYNLSGDMIELDRPHVAEQTTTGTTIYFKDQKQYQEWLGKQRAAGIGINVNWTQEQVRYSTGHIPIRLSLGGTEGLQAIGYIALTYLAHHFPDQARQPSSLPFKEFVLGIRADQSVWWESADLMKGLPQNPFAFGHTIAIGVSGTHNEAYARVSLFSTLNFGVHLGAVEANFDRTVVVHVDPHSEHPPNDIKEEREERLLFTSERPAQPSAVLDNLINSGAGRNAFKELLRRINRWQREKTAQMIFDELSALDDMPKDERDARVIAIVDTQGQRLLNLMQFVINGLKPRFEANAATAHFARRLERLVAADPNSPDGLSVEANTAVGVAKLAVATEISRHLDVGDLTVDRLSMLIGGGPGAALVGRAIIDPLFNRVFPV
jgi:hypothetical protein